MAGYRRVNRYCQDPSKLEMGFARTGRTLTVFGAQMTAEAAWSSRRRVTVAASTRVQARHDAFLSLAKRGLWLYVRVPGDGPAETGSRHCWELVLQAGPKVGDVCRCSGNASGACIRSNAGPSISRYWSISRHFPQRSGQLGRARYTAAIRAMYIVPLASLAWRIRMQLMIDARTGRRGSVADWVDAFTALWHGGRDRLDDFMTLFGPQIKLSAPGLRSTVGHEAGREAFRRTFEVFPDMRASVERWACDGDALFIEMTFSATIGGDRTLWRGVDRFLIREGTVVERVAFLNPLHVRRALLRNPAGWAQLLRLRRSRL